VSLWAGVAAQLGNSLVVLVGQGQDQRDVVVIDEGHEGVVLSHGEHSLAHQVDEASLVGDVVDGGVDGDDDFAQLVALIVKSALDLEVADAALLGVGAEDVVVLVDEAIELVLQGLDAGLLVVDLELQVSGEHWHDLVTFRGLASRSPEAALVAGVLGGGLLEESIADFANSFAHGSLAPGNLVVA